MIWLVIVGGVVVAGLAFYAGQLLFMLRRQKQQAELVRQERIDNIITSIQVIALAMQQQQCNLSEGSIRICNLLLALPLRDPPDFTDQYPSTFALFDHVKHLPTHDARKALSREERDQQDQKREAQEAKLQAAIQREAEKLRQLKFD